MLKQLQDRVLNVNFSNCFELIVDIYSYQSKSNPVFKSFLELIGRREVNIKSLHDLRFLPIDLFKTNRIKTENWDEEYSFGSSGTTGTERSIHLIQSLDFYHKIAQKCFEYHFDNLKEFEFLALLPNYIERPDSSLIEMVRFFVKNSNQFGQEVFFSNEFQKLSKTLESNLLKNKPVILFGVSFALLDFAESFQISDSNLIIIETGGMKTQRREMEKTELIKCLQSAFPQSKVCSEYGMTEMLSQAYAMDGLHFSAYPGLQFLISDPSDPYTILEPNKRGLINVIDLANVHSCSFIQTGDLGMLDEQNNLKVLGRHQFEDLRGCAQLYEE